MADNEITGVSLIAGEYSDSRTGTRFHARNPASGDTLEPGFYSAQSTDIHHAASHAAAAFPATSALSAPARAQFLRRIAERLTEVGDSLVARAHLETSLPLPRLEGELKRTTGQLRLFADTVEEGSWVNARIDEADPGRKPIPKPDIRSMLRPLGPVAVFGASNFPLAFSVCGGDTASALAAGNPVIVKGHPAHPGTSELAGLALRQAVLDCGLPKGTFSLLVDAGIEVGVELVQHPAIKAVGFTGSYAAGRSLMRLAGQRPEPIPCYAEMGSVNPVFILPNAMLQAGGRLAEQLQSSFTLGSGQFCTKPGLVFVPERNSADFLNILRAKTAESGHYGMLTHAIAEKYSSEIAKRKLVKAAQLIAEGVPESKSGAAVGSPAVFGMSLDQFRSDSHMGEEIFGPSTLLIHYKNESDLLQAALEMEGHLTATIHATDEDTPIAVQLAHVLETKVGRVLFNGFPTGVEVCHAMVHGGPYPATSDGRSTSVGTQAIFRFARPVCFQDYPDAALAQELQRANPMGIMRMVNGVLTRDAQN